jgi:hypothetical protein
VTDKKTSENKPEEEAPAGNVTTVKVLTLTRVKVIRENGTVEEIPIS